MTLTAKILAQYLKFPLKSYIGQNSFHQCLSTKVCVSVSQLHKYGKSPSCSSYACSTFHKVHVEKKPCSSENQHVVLSQRPLTSLIPLQEVKTLQQHLQFKEQLLLTFFTDRRFSACGLPHDPEEPKRIGQVL